MFRTCIDVRIAPSQPQRDSSYYTPLDSLVSETELRSLQKGLILLGSLRLFCAAKVSVIAMCLHKSNRLQNVENVLRELALPARRLLACPSSRGTCNERASIRQGIILPVHIKGSGCHGTLRLVSLLHC